MENSEPIMDAESIKDLKDRIRENFMFEIAEFLTKKEKIALREISKTFEKEIFSQIRINLFLKRSSEEEDFNSLNLNLSNVLKYYQNMEKLKLQNLILNDKNYQILEVIINHNKPTLKIFHIMNVEYEQYDYIEKIYSLLDTLPLIEEISLGGAGNRDRFALHLEKNGKSLSFKKNIKVLKIDNLPLGQIQFLLSYFDQALEVYIENCSLDEDISQLISDINKKKRTKLILSSNGFDSSKALDSIRTILSSQSDLTEFSLKGIWFRTIQTLSNEIKSIKCLERLDISGSKNLYGVLPINSFDIFKQMPQLIILDLSDSRVKTETLVELLKSFNDKVSSTLIELHLMKNLLGPSTFEVIASFIDKIPNVKLLNLAFNPQISNKGFNSLAENCEKFPFSNLDMRGCGVFLKLALPSFNILLFQKTHMINKMDFYYNIFKDSDYEVFVRSIYKLFSGASSDTQAKQPVKKNIGMKIFFKLKYNPDFHMKIFSELDFLYKNFNLMMR